MTFVKATFTKRVIAYLLDTIVVVIPVLLLAVLFDPYFDSRLLSAFTEPVSFIYYVTLEGTRKQRTIGKRIMNLKVIKTNGEKMDLMTSLARNVGKLLISFTYTHGILCLLIPGERQAIHDKFAHCLVVEVKRSNA